MTTPAPWPPGAIDQPGEATQFMAYLDALDGWLGERRETLDRLDRAILQLPQPAGQTADLMVALSVWQAVQRRRQELMATWDSGRVGPVQLRQLAQLAWGRLDDDNGAGPSLSVNLGEACRLCDALTAQLASSLNLSPLADQLSRRLKDLRAQVERLRDQVKLEPAETRAASANTVDAMAADTAELAAKADRGGDIGGSLGPMEIRAAKLERDLIVGQAQRRQQADQTLRLKAAWEALGRRQEAVAQLVAETAGRVFPAPKYAVPRLDALGPPPEPGPVREAYSQRLAQVGRALEVVERANRQALDEWRRLVHDWAELADPAAAARDPQLAALAAQATDLLNRRPTPLAVVKPILEAYRALLAVTAENRSRERT
ncbi:MAG: hypothetical protein LBK42_05780 [Propionibacteriaceae bacterium]|nr:hypothetical protein [Propionibacteriaceae bacterium]